MLNIVVPDRSQDASEQFALASAVLDGIPEDLDVHLIPLSIHIDCKTRSEVETAQAYFVERGWGIQSAYNYSTHRYFPFEKGGVRAIVNIELENFYGQPC